MHVEGMPIGQSSRGAIMTLCWHPSHPSHSRNHTTLTISPAKNIQQSPARAVIYGDADGKIKIAFQAPSDRRCQHVRTGRRLSSPKVKLAFRR